MGLFPKLRAIERASLQSMNSFKTLVQLTYFIKITWGKPKSWIGEAGIGWAGDAQRAQEQLSWVAQPYIIQKEN